MRAVLSVALSAVLVAIVAAAACSSTPVLTAGSTFNAPSSVAVTWAGDRDLLFVSNAAGDDLTGMYLCPQHKVADGGYEDDFGRPNPNTCTENDDQQLIPAPIRVFPASITAGARPNRIAGVRMLGAAEEAIGAVIVAGLDTTADAGVRQDPILRLIDANNVLDLGQRKPGAKLRIPFDVTLPSPAVDVVASDTPAHTVKAFAISQGTTGDAVLTAFVTTPGTATEQGPKMQPAARCTLDLVATRLALVPGTDDLLPNEGGPAHVYVADGTPDGVPGGKGDGAVEVSVPAMPPYDPATLVRCPVFRRLRASDPADPIPVARPLRSIALSPTFDQTATTKARGGSILLGVTLPSNRLCGTPGNLNCGEGSVVIVQTGGPGGTTSRIAPAPPADFFTAAADAPAMAPIRALATARDITFLRPIPNCPPELRPNACTQITAGLTTRVTSLGVQLAAAASTDDGGTVIINVIDRRFVDDLRDESPHDPNADLPPALSNLTFFPSQPLGVPSPALVFPPPLPAPATDPFIVSGLPHPCPDINTPGCLNKGVTIPLRWQVTWRGIMPGLESVAGTLRRDAASNTIRFELTAQDLTPWITSPTLALQAGDIVHLDAVANPQFVCPELKAIPTSQDIRIQAIEPRALVLDPGNHDGFLPFDIPATCGSVLSAVDVRSGPSPAGEWLIVAGTNVRGRVAHSQLFVAKAQRFDYPLDLPAARPQFDTEVAFAPTGPLPLQAGQQFTFSTARGTQPTTIRETNLFLQGPVGDVFTYQSAHFNSTDGKILFPNIVFTALMGNNALLRASPANLGSSTALLVYR